MPGFIPVNALDPATAASVQQLIDAFTGARNTPVAVYVTDALAYALSLKNSDAGGKGLQVIDADGVTVLLDAHHGTVALEQPTISDFTLAQHTHATASAGGPLANSGAWGDPTFMVLL